MQVTSDLRLAVPVRFSDAGEPLVWAYHTPISRDVFQANYRVISGTNAAIWAKGFKYAAMAGGKVANLTLRDVAKQDAAEWGGEDTGPAILNEIKRLTVVLAPGANGFDQIPVDVAIGRGIIDEEEWSEAEASIVFFTVGYATEKKAARKGFADLVSSVIGVSTTSLPPTDFLASLQTSIQGETFESEQASSIPS